MPFQSSNAHMGRSMLPIITTKKIHVSSRRKLIEVDFGINIPGDEKTRDQLMRSPFAETLYFYFIVLTDSTAGLISNLKDILQRPRIIQSIYNNHVIHVLDHKAIKMLSYREVLENHKTMGFTKTDLTNDYNNEFRSTVNIEYSPKSEPREVLIIGETQKSKAKIKEEESGKKGKKGPSYSATETGRTIGGSSNDYGFSNFIPTSEEDQERIMLPGSLISYEYLETDNLHLICFVDVDLRNNNFSSGNDTIYYDHLLERHPERGHLEPPKVIRSYYVNSPVADEDGSLPPGGNIIRPYHGPVHYHDANPENPEAYVGWMAGHAEGEMGPKLELIESPNYKITSDLKVFDQNIYSSGHPGQDQISNSWFSEELLSNSNLKETLKHNNLIKSTSQLLRDSKKYYNKNALNNPNILDYEFQQTSFVNYVSDPTDPDRAPLESCHHGFAISINFLEIMKYRSRLGYLLSFHEEKGNHDFIRTALINSPIKRISFYRERVVNLPYEINERQSHIYSKYDKNDFGDYIVSSSDEELIFGQVNFKNRLLFAETEKGTLEEVEILQAPIDLDPGSPNYELSPSPEFSRQFIVRDQDLFHNINYGKYTYKVEIVLEDGIFKSSQLLYKTISAALDEFDQILFDASIPQTRSEDSTDIPGGYNYNLETFTESFKEKVAPLRLMERLVTMYSIMKNVLSGQSRQSLAEEMVDLNTKLNFNTAKLADILKFQEILREMLHALGQVVYSGVDPSSDRKIENFNSTTENKKGGNLNTVEITSKTGVITEAIAEGDLLVDFNHGTEMTTNFQSPEIYLTPTNSAILGSAIEPFQFITLATSTYETNNEGFIGVGVSKATAKANRIGKSKQKRRTKTKGGTTVLVTRKTYNTKSKAEKINIKNKINYLLKSQTGFSKKDNIGESDKPDSFYPLAIQRYNGGISLGVSGGKTINFAGGISAVAELLEYVPTGLSDEIKKVICDSVYKKDSRDHFLEEIERRYEELVGLRDTLGAFYEMAHSLILFSSDIVSSRIENVSYEDKFKGAATPPLQKPIKEIDIFKDQKRLTTLISPTLPPRTINLKTADFSLPENYVFDDRAKRLVCIKMQSYDEATLAVNDVVFLEV